jgi:transposase-like protein
MAERSGSGRGKGRKNISLDEHEKKAILDTVSQSDRPVAQMLRELGISRSTYYNWLSRYDEEGLEGLKDKRDSEKPSPDEETAPSQDVAEEEAKGALVSGEDQPALPEEEKKPEEVSRAPQPEEVRGTSPYSDTIAPKMGETPKHKGPETQVPGPEVPESEKDTAEVPGTGTSQIKAEAESKKEEPKLTEKSAKPQPPKSPPKGSGGSGRHSTFFILLVIIAVIAGIVMTVCMYNASGYFFKASDGKLTLWKGKFAPFGKAQVSGFNMLDVGSVDVSPVLDKRFYGEWDAVNALFSHLLNQAEVFLESADTSEFGNAGQFFGLAEELTNGGEPGAKPKRMNLAFKQRLLKKRIFHAEKSLANMYRDLSGILSDIKAQGVPVHGNIDQMIEESNSRASELEAWNSPVTPVETIQDTGAPEEAPAEMPAEAEGGPETEKSSD